MSENILKSKDINYLNQVGGKAFQLKKLIDEGFFVPKFICIPVKVMQNHLNSLGEVATLSGIVKNEIISYLNKNFSKNTLFSVRSSSIAEDSSQTSFAGQFETYLRVSIKDIPNAIEKCWRSSYQDSVILYAKSHNVNKEDLQMGVIIQEMIEAESSGVVFSSNPQGLINETVIVYGSSTGDGVVEDKVPTTSYYYNQTDGSHYYETQTDSPILKEKHLKELALSGKKLSEIFSLPVDIEFAILNDILYYLQVRPVTTLDMSNPLIMDNSNIVESYPGLSSPLTQGFVTNVYYKIFRGLALRCIGTEKTITEIDDKLRNMVGSVNGRMYYKISNWYTALKFLPFQKKVIPLWQTMLGVENKQYDNKRNNITFGKRITTYRKIISSMIGIPRKMEQLDLDFKKANDYFNAHFNNYLSNKELLDLYKKIEKDIFADWDLTLLNDMYGFIFTGLLESVFKKSGIKDYSKYTNEYISGISNIESMKPVRSLLALSIEVMDDKTLYNTISNIKTEKETREYLEKDSLFGKKFLKYIDEFGDRSLEELKLETKTFRTNPSILIKVILNYCSSPDELRKAYESTAIKEMPFVMTDQLGWVNKKLASYCSKKAMTGIYHREVSRLNRSRSFGMVRSIFLAVGKNLVAKGVFTVKEDIFHISYKDVVKEMKTPFLTKKIVDKKIASNNRQMAIFEKLPAYTRLVFTDAEFNKYPQNINSIPFTDSVKFLSGTPSSSGIVQGEVVVIHTPSFTNNMSGKILVTQMTDPGWVFLLTTAKGVIAEKGSLLSHTAIVSRELGIPSIVAVDGATKKLKTGDFIRMNGNTGEIEVISYEEL